MLDVETTTSGIEMKRKIDNIIDDDDTPSTTKKRKSTDSGIEEEEAIQTKDESSKKESDEGSKSDTEENNKPRNKDSFSSAFNVTSTMNKWYTSGAQLGQLVHYNPNQWVQSMVPLMMHGAYGPFHSQFAKSLLTTKRTESS